MIEFNEYEKFLNELIYYFNPCYTAQLHRALTKQFGNLDSRSAYELLAKYQNDGRILLSEDGWAMTKGKYVQITKDSKYENVNVSANPRLQNITRQVKDYCDLKHFRLLDCLWVLIDMLPDSMDFALTNKPFQISLIAKGQLYQIISIPASEEDLRIDMLTSLPADYYENFRTSVNRIVVMERADHYFKLPKNIGIKFVCVIDHNKPSHIRITKTFDEGWNDGK